MAPPSPDRRADPVITPGFVDKILKHVDDEEERQVQEAVQRALDAKRFEDGARTMAQLAADLAPLRKMYYALLGCSGLALAVLMMGGWIYTNDRNDAKVDRQELRTLTSTMTEQSSAIKVILARMNDFKEEQDRMRAAMERAALEKRK
jgi:hypothetical protein